MAKWAWPLLIAASLAFAGCSPTAPEKPAAGEKPAADAGSKPAGETPAEQPKEALTVPEDLKTDAFAYYGLDYTDAIPMEVVVDGPGKRTGTQTTKLVGVKDGVATYEIARTGSLSDLGTMTIEARKDGIYVKSTSIGEIEGEQLELPTGLTAGKTWDTSLKIKQSSGQTVENKSKFKVVGTEKVKTAAGEYDALLITSQGPMTMAGTTSQMSTKGWFVKGRGAVKMSITTTPKGGKPSTMVIQETK